MSLDQIKIDDAFRVLHQRAHEFISDQQEYLEADYGFGQFDQYTVDRENQSITFTNADGTALSFRFQAVGKLEAANQQWSWRWDANDVSPEELENLDVIKNYGDFYDFTFLTKPTFGASQQIAWALTAIAAYLRTAKGVFRIADGDTAEFIYLQEILA